jgi:GWxTD domain-containing protein
VLTYARALAQLESIQQPRLTMALAANTGSLIRRIRRLMEPTQAAAENYPGAGAAWAMTLLWMAGVGAATVHGAQTPVPMPRLVELGSAPHVQGPSPFVLPAIPAASLADHARDTLLFDPFLSAQVVQPAVPEPLDGDQRERKEAALRKELETPYRKWLDEDVAYIISSEERNAFWKLDTDDERDRFIEEFWLRRDPTPGTLENEAKAEHYRRIAYANENFGAALPGWRTDRGHVYIILGPPDEIQRFRFTYDPNGQRSDLPPQITWLYHSVAGVGDEVRLRFQDLAGTGEFRLSADQRDLLSGLHFARIDSPGRLPMQVRYDYFRGTPSSTLMNLTMQFAGKDLKFQMQDGLNKSAINVFGRVSSMTRRPISTFEPTLETSVLAGAGERANQLYQQSVPLAPGRYHLNIVAKDIMSGNMNVYEAALDVPHFDDDKMSTSSLVLADAIEKLPAKRDVGAMFAIGDDKVRPRLDGGFSNTEKMGVYLQVYNFAPDETQKPSGSVEFEVDKAASGEKIIDLSQDVAAIPNASASQVTIEKLLPLNALTPGAYTLTVTVTDKKRNQSVQQRENFTVTAQ